MITRRPATAAATGILVGAAVGLAGATAADDQPAVPAGSYRETDPSGTYTWNFTPCGPDCTTVGSPDDRSVDGLTFRLDDGAWTASGPVRLRPPSCGSLVAATVHYRFDAAALDGEFFSTVDDGICGFSPGFTIPAESFRLTRSG